MNLLLVCHLFLSHLHVGDGYHLRWSLNQSLALITFLDKLSIVMPESKTYQKLKNKCNKQKFQCFFMNTIFISLLRQNTSMFLTSAIYSPCIHNYRNTRPFIIYLIATNIKFSVVGIFSILLDQN